MESTKRIFPTGLFFLDTEEVGSSSLLEPTIPGTSDSGTSAESPAQGASAPGPSLVPLRPARALLSHAIKGSYVGGWLFPCEPTCDVCGNDLREHWRGRACLAVRP